MINTTRLKSIFYKKQTSYHICCYYKLYNSVVNERYNKISDLYNEMNENNGRLDPKIEKELQDGVFYIEENIIDYESYFMYMEF